MPSSGKSDGGGDRVYKILSRQEWDDTKSAGVFHGSAVDTADGFIHLSSDAQVAATAALHFSGRDDLVLAAVDADSLGAALVWEPSRGGDLFPHLYGDLPLTAIVSADPMPLGPDGLHHLPGLSEGKTKAR